MNFEINYTNQNDECNIWIEGAGMQNGIKKVSYVFKYGLFENMTAEDKDTKFLVKLKNVKWLPIVAALEFTNGETAEIHCTITRRKLDAIHDARSVLSGNLKGTNELALRKEMEFVDQFDYASELLLREIDKEGGEARARLYQELAKYIYKDQSLPSSFKFDKAFDVLNKKDPLLTSTDCETLGLTGAIYKRKWLYDHLHTNLLLSGYYYKRGFEIWKQYIEGNGDIRVDGAQNDKGYNAINYAYIMELMDIDKMDELGYKVGPGNIAYEGLRIAQETRVYILELFITDPFSANEPDIKCPDEKDWVLATIAEAYFGLCLYDKALVFIRKYLKDKTQQWEVQTFSQQLFSLAYLQQARKQVMDDYPSVQFGLNEHEKNIDINGINECLNALEIRATASSSGRQVKNDGKKGIALSGGGFRASLFHIGVLAALAEQDELKDIEVISCVSGGSIIGAYYYLKLKVLLERKKDNEIKKEDYITLVKEIEEGFLDGVQKNLRMRIFSNIFENFHMLDKKYSRTNRIGKLYEKHLFKPLLKFERAKNKKELKGATPAQKSWYEEILEEGRHIYMKDLFIAPADPGFNFNTDNWKRRNKVPQLILNATSVNTGHNWRFTASWMGEPASSIIADIDVKPRLRRMYYNDAPSEEYQNFRMCYAVSASSCVPVMFEPLPMHDLYPDMDLQLIDGGLHDNQGITALIDEECKNMIISDASGQLPTSTKSTGNSFSLFMRTDNILQERVRELQFVDVKERYSTLQVNSLYTVHLKSGLDTRQLSWIGCDDPERKISPFVPDTGGKGETPYGILRESQQLISEIRTDLDAFSDIEAYALIYDGYKQMGHDYHQQNGTTPNAPLIGWDFLHAEKFLTDSEEAKKVRNRLAVASRVPLKLFYLMPKAARIFVVAMLGVACIALFWLYFGPQYKGTEVTLNGLMEQDWTLLPAFSMTGGKIMGIVVVFILGFFIKSFRVIYDRKGFIREWTIKICLALGGFIIFNLYLYLFNWIYVLSGRMSEVRKNRK